MKKIKILLSVVAMSFVMVGCGGGGSSGDGSSNPAPSAKNTLENSEGETALGYYGANIYIGNHQGNKYWDIKREGYSGQVILEMPNHGNELSILDTTSGSNDISMADYGVSADAMTINIDDDYDGSTDLRIEIKRSVNSQTYDAYLSNPHTGEGFDIVLMTTID
jgi:hypothetical protein